MKQHQNKLTKDFKIFPTVDKVAHKSVLRAHLAMTVHEVSRLMEQHKVSSVVIELLDRKRIVSIEDLLKHINNGGSINTTLMQLPEHALACIRSNEHILTALERLNASGDRYLAVINPDDSLLGILTYTDLLSAADPTLLIENKTIGELISRSVQITFSADWFLEDVLCHFTKLEDSIVVVDDGTPLGIITSKDVFRILASGASTALQLSAYMTSPVVTTSSASTVREALELLKTHRIKRLVVINDLNKLVGVITQSELVGFTYGSWITLSKHHSGELRELVSILETTAADSDATDMLQPMTGLENRNMLLININQEIDRMHRYLGPTFCLLLVTAETCEEQYPHTIVIKTLANALSKVVRTMDTIYHWDEKSFALLLPQTDPDQADRLIARLQEKLFDLSLLKQFSYGIHMKSHPYTIGDSGCDFLDAIADKSRIDICPTATNDKAQA
jgi:predicted transcriptional regulator/GGDEF domain-containing protein